MPDDLLHGNASLAFLGDIIALRCSSSRKKSRMPPLSLLTHVGISNSACIEITSKWRRPETPHILLSPRSCYDLVSACRVLVFDGNESSIVICSSFLVPYILFNLRSLHDWLVTILGLDLVERLVVI